MNRFILFLSILLTGASPLLGDFAIPWPPTPRPPGINPAIWPAPRMDWFEQFQRQLNIAKKMPTIDLIFDGDSITDWWQTTGKDVWAQHYANRNAVDFGIHGDKTENLLWRVQQGQVDNLHPKLICLMIGTNNRMLPEDQIAEGVKADVAEYRKRCPKAVILLQAILPRFELPTDPFRDKIKTINKSLATFADGKNVLFIDFGDKFLELDGKISTTMLPDFTHPNAKGYAIWADAIQPIVDKYVPASANLSSTPTTAPTSAATTTTVPTK